MAKVNGDTATAAGRDGQRVTSLRALLPEPHRNSVFVRAVSWRRASQPRLDRGQIDLFCPEASNSLPLMRGGKVKAYAVLSKNRWPAAPDVPTIDEAGLPGLYIPFWHAFWAARCAQRSSHQAQCGGRRGLG